jgi:DNA-binding NarL/FixJ family response regulator
MTADTAVVIAEDHPVFRKGLADLVREAATFRIVGEATTGQEALDLVRRHRPQIAVLDIEMPEMSGLDVAAAIRDEGIDTALVVLTMYRDSALLRRALELGVRGYVLKDSAVTDIVACLNMVAAGRTYVSGALSVETSESREDGTKGLAAVGRLTPAERRILARVAEGLTSSEIANALDISPKTVENHRSHICRKLGLRGPQALLRFALEHKAALE